MKKKNIVLLETPENNLSQKIAQFVIFLVFFFYFIVSNLRKEGNKELILKELFLKFWIAEVRKYIIHCKQCMPRLRNCFIFSTTKLCFQSFLTLPVFASGCWVLFVSLFFLRDVIKTNSSNFETALENFFFWPLLNILSCQIQKT